MNPSALNSSFGEKRKRRTKMGPDSRDYICPCGKAYLSYPALFTHIKLKHDKKAPGQITKPKVAKRQIRHQTPEKRQNLEEKSELCQAASESPSDVGHDLQPLLFFVSSFKKEDSTDLKPLYSKTAFYEFFREFDNDKFNPKFNTNAQLYEETCTNVLCKFLHEVSKVIDSPYYFDQVFMLVLMMVKCINKEKGNPEQVDSESAQNLVDYVNTFFVEHYPKFKEKYNLQEIEIFEEKNMARLVQFLFSWLNNNKFVNAEVKITEDYFQETE